MTFPKLSFPNLTSIVTAQKKSISMKENTASFVPAVQRTQAYIEPTFSKIQFEREKPPVLLISAVGATGKTTLARVLSHQTGLPLLDLSKHKPVGDNTLTGLLTSAFKVEDLSRVFEGVGSGTFGVIVDGIDEGRSKTTEKAFEAFLDDLAKLCKNAQNTSFVLLGRTQALEDCWLYLEDKGVSTGLLTILPFDIDGARRYIDAFSDGAKSAHPEEYVEVRDMILDRLSAAFQTGAEKDQSFMSFIGYPPVLDAIVTLLREEQNYHKLKGQLSSSDANDVEVQLLQRIAMYICRREKEDKVVPNIVTQIVAELPEEESDAIKERIFELEEQCRRLVSYCLGRRLSLSRIGVPLLDEKYEAQLATFLSEHPFVSGREFRNAVFEAVALSVLILSAEPDAIQLALEYASRHKHNYHLIYLLHNMAAERQIPIGVLPVIVGSALEFRSRTSSVEISIEGSDTPESQRDAQTVDIEIGIITGTAEGQSREFIFQSDLKGAAMVELGQSLSSTYVSLPCEVVLSSAQELDFTAPVEITAGKISLRSPAIILRPSTGAAATDKHVLLEAQSIDCTAEAIATNGLEFVLTVADRSGLTYPAIKYVKQKDVFDKDSALQEKYMRVRRILVQFRSHSRGTMARYKGKIEHERVLRNELGQIILDRLLKDGILTRDGSFYFLQPENVDKHLGVSYIDLRKGLTSARLKQYLQSIRLEAEP